MSWLRSRWTVVALVPAFFLAGFGIVSALAGGSDDQAPRAAPGSTGDVAGTPPVETVFQETSPTETAGGNGNGETAGATTTTNGNGAGGTTTGGNGNGNGNGNGARRPRRHPGRSTSTTGAGTGSSSSRTRRSCPTSASPP